MKKIELYKSFLNSKRPIQKSILSRIENTLTISSKKSPTSISRGWIAFLFSWNCFKNMI